MIFVYFCCIFYCNLRIIKSQRSTLLAKAETWSATQFSNLCYAVTAIRSVTCSLDMPLLLL